MREALQKAIYFEPCYETREKLNGIYFEYSNEEEFRSILNNLKYNIDVVSLFGKDEFLHSLLYSIGSYYKELLLDRIDIINIVSRKEYRIIICKKDVNVNMQENIGGNMNLNMQNKNAAIIKIDSVLAELNKYSSNSSVFFYPLFFIAGFLTAYKLPEILVYINK